MFLKLTWTKRIYRVRRSCSGPKIQTTLLKRSPVYAELCFYFTSRVGGLRSSTRLIDMSSSSIPGLQSNGHQTSDSRGKTNFKLASGTGRLGESASGCSSGGGCGATGLGRRACGGSQSRVGGRVVGRAGARGRGAGTAGLDAAGGGRDIRRCTCVNSYTVASRIQAGLLARVYVQTLTP